MLSANEINDIELQAFIGKPSDFHGICKVYPLTMNEIIEKGVNQYQGELELLLLDEQKIFNIVKEKTGQEIPIEQIDPLKYLIGSTQQNDTFLLELQSIFFTFIKEEVLFLPKINSILVGNPKDKRLINSKNFRDFQDILKIQNKKEIKTPPPENETPGQKKMRLLRERVEAVKKKQSQKDGKGQSLLDLLEIGEIYGIDSTHTIFAFYNLIKRHQMKEKWDQDIQMLCAGASSEKIKTQYWGESLKND